MTGSTGTRSVRGLAVAMVSILALLGASLIASPAQAATAPCYPTNAAGCNPALSVASPTTTSAGISANINNLIPDTTVTWTWTNGTQTFTQTTAVNSAGVAAIVMPAGIAGTYTITASGYTTDSKGARTPVTRQGTAVVQAESQPSLGGTLVSSGGKSKLKITVTPPAGVTCTGQFRFRIEYKKKKSASYYKRIPRTYYTKGASHKLTINPIAGRGWYRAVVAGKCGVKGFITSPLVYLKK